MFTKNFSNTALHVSWTGTRRIYNCDSCCKRWYFTFNGAECAAPLPIDGVVYMYKGSGSNVKDTTRVRHIEGHCNNIHKGKARCAWDSGSVIVPDTVEVMTPRQAGIQCPGSMLKKFPNRRLRSRDKTSFPA